MDWKLMVFLCVTLLYAYVATTTAADCDYNPCQNNGTCVNSTITGQYNCTCIEGFIGTDCDTSETQATVCDSQPCQNGGQCEATSASEYDCVCASGYTGTDCSVNIDDCDPNPCQNGGTCEDDVGGFVCSCATGYSGSTCESEFASITCIFCLSEELLSVSEGIADIVNASAVADFMTVGMPACVDGSTSTATCSGSNPMCYITETLYIPSDSTTGDSATIRSLLHGCIVDELEEEMFPPVDFNGTCQDGEEVTMGAAETAGMLMGIRSAGWTDVDTFTVVNGGCNCATDNCNTLGLQDEDDEDEDHEDLEDEDEDEEDGHDDEHDETSDSKSSKVHFTVSLITSAVFLASTIFV